MKTGPQAPMEPIKDREALTKIKEQLANSPRDLCLFTLGTNTAFRASDILALNVGDVKRLGAGDPLWLKEKKTGKRRFVTVNAAVVQTLQALIASRGIVPDDAPLFVGEKRGTRLTVETLGRLWKSWCKAAGLEGNFASHTGRKTWAYQQRTMHGASIDLLQKAFGHSSGAVTMAYAYITDDEMASLYNKSI